MTTEYSRRAATLVVLSMGLIGIPTARAAKDPASATVDVTDLGRPSDGDWHSIITAALVRLQRMGGGTLLMPPVGGYRISDTIEIGFAPCHIELQDNIILMKTTKASAIVFKGSQARPLSGVSVVGVGSKRKIDGNGRAMRDYVYSTQDTFYSCVLFQWCDRWLVRNVYAYNGLVNCIRAFKSGIGNINDCDASHSEYDNGHSVDFDAGWRQWSKDDPTSWSRARILRARAWNCHGLGITAYGATKVAIVDAEVWDCGNDKAGHPNNGGGISVEGNFGTPSKPDLLDRGCVVLRATIRDCWNQGLHVSAAGTSLVSSRIEGTRAPRNRRNPLGVYGSNVIVFAAASLTVSDTVIFESARHGIALSVAGNNLRPTLRFAGCIANARGCGIYCRQVASLTVLPQSRIIDCGTTLQDAGILFEKGQPDSAANPADAVIAGVISGSSGYALVMTGVRFANLHDLILRRNFSSKGRRDFPVWLKGVSRLQAARITGDDGDDITERIRARQKTEA